ncbi:MAG: winged helix-turn-helix domain-containing protein [Candidatus Tectomicrobia bacterium]|nr:winged helix-turn-helix domain-containing protein [Candidatus Tectomicrobia bacterium]
MKRHPWRQGVPRPRHPQGTAEKQETFKKTSPRK